MTGSGENKCFLCFFFFIVFVKTFFCVKESASNWLKHKGEFIGTMLEQLRNPRAALGTSTGELLSLVSLCLFLHLLHFPSFSACVYTLDRQKSSGYCTVPKFMSSLFKSLSQTCWLFIPGFWKGNVLSLIGPGI